MKKWFWIGLLTASVLFVGICFKEAYLYRGYNSVGGEVFTVALPLLIARQMLAAVTSPFAPTAVTTWLIFPASTLMENLPSMFVTTPCEAPFTLTAAPMTGSPS